MGEGVHLTAALLQGPAGKPDPGGGDPLHPPPQARPPSRQIQVPELWSADCTAQLCLPLAFALTVDSLPPLQDNPGGIWGNEGPGTAQLEGSGPGLTIPASPESPSAQQCHTDWLPQRLAPGSALHL